MKALKKIINNKKAIIIVIFILALINVSFVFTSLSLKKEPAKETIPPSVTQSSSELTFLKNQNFTFNQLTTFFTNLAKQKGAVYAYDLLKIAPLPPNTDFHLLGHAIGDILFLQQGTEGIKICTHDFRNACSHSIVVALFQAKGEKALDEISKVCRQAPGGKGAYTMCFHGLGHGVLSYTDYDLAPTVTLCKKTGTKEYQNQEYTQCIGGAIMEMISGGGHNPELWAKQRPNFLKSEDPLYPCSTLITDEAKNMCYLYITPFLFEAVGANMATPTAIDFEKAFQICNNLPLQDAQYQKTCFGGFGKEFVVLAQDRDIRNVGNMKEEQLAKVYDWCLLAQSSLGTESCIEHAMQSLFWGGENKPHAAITFCTIITNPSQQNTCFSNLIQAVSYYQDNKIYRRDFCSTLPKQIYMTCQRQLL